MPDYFLKKKSLLDRFKDNHGRTGYIQSARAEHTWSNPIKRNRRTKELNGWIKSFAGKKHIRKLARFNTLNNGKNEEYNMENFDCLRYGSTLELPNGVCIPVNATIRCPRRAPFTFRITDIHKAEAGNPSKYVIRGYYPVYGPEQKPSDEFDIPCNDVSDIEQWIKTNEKGNSMQNEAMSLKGFIENLTEKLTKQFDLDLEVVQAYLDTHTQEIQELLDDNELSLKEKVLFVRSEIKGEKDEGYGGTKSVMSIWGNRPRDVYPEVSYSSVNDMYNTLLKYGYGDMHPIYYKNNSPEQIKEHILGYFKWTPTNSNADIEADALAAATMIKNNFNKSEAVKPANEKLGYEKGHKNSKGEDAPWVIRSHEDNRILASFANKKDAEEHLKRMKQYSKSEAKQSERQGYAPYYFCRSKYTDGELAVLADGDSIHYLPSYNIKGFKDTIDYGTIATSFEPIENPETSELHKIVQRKDGRNIIALTQAEFDDFAENNGWSGRDKWFKDILRNRHIIESIDTRERTIDDYDTLTDGLSELGFVPSSNIRNGMIYPYRSRFTATKDGVKYHFWIHEDPSGEYTDYIEVWGGKFTTNGDPEDPETTKFNTVIDVLDDLKSVKKYEAHDLETYKSDVLSDLVVNLFHGEDGAKKLVDEYADAIEDAFARGDTSMEIATEIDTMAGKHESKNVSLKEIARTLDTAINKDGNYSVKDNTSGVTATDKDRTQTIRVFKDLKVELEDKDGKHSYEAQSLRDLSKYIRRAVKGEYINEDFHKTQVKDAVYDVINRHNLNNAVKVSYLGNSVVCKYADRTLRIQPDLLTTMSTKDGDNVDTYPTNLKELDGYLDRVFGHYADELVESKQSEGLKLDYVDTITVPQWLWDAYTYSQEYSIDEYGVDLNDDEMAIFYDFKEKYKDCHLDDRGEEPDFHSRNDFDCYGGNCYVVDVYTKTDVKEKKSEGLFNKQELEALAQGADILDQLQYRFSFSFYSPKTYTDAVDTALAMNAEGDKRIAHETIGDSEFRLYTDDPYDAIRFRDGLSNRAGIPAEDLASTFRSAVGIRKNGGYATEAEQDTIGRYAAENYVSFSVSEDNSTMYVEGELPNVVEFLETIK